MEVLKTFVQESIDCVVTSPPYWLLRDYGVEGQLGMEKTFEEYIANLCFIFDEVKRVLKPTGSCWVNLGDSYSNSGKGGDSDRMYARRHTQLGKLCDIRRHGKPTRVKGLPPKSLCNIPARFSIEMQNRGWILRNVIIWHKPNCMPSSVKDRFTVDFEYLFFFVKNKKYWFETQYEPVKQCSIERLERAVSNKHKWIDGPDGQTRHTMNSPRPNRNTKIPLEIAEKIGSPRARYHRYKGGGNVGRENNCAISTYQFENSDYLVSPWNTQKGRNKRSVWSIPTQPYKDAHFATFPESLVETPIRSGCPKAGVVLDPFCGSGTTLAVAKRLCRSYVGIELNPAYIKMAERRISKEDSIFNP